MNSALIILSGGLDSYIALDIASSEYEIKLALNFDYGQKAFKEENEASKKIAVKYNIDLKTIELPFLKDISDNALTNDSNNDFSEFEQLWIPNRNGLFLNIAGCFCDKFNIEKIIMGLNFEEAQDFSDNSVEFIKSANKFLHYSTKNHCEIIAPCSNMTKTDIVNYAIDKKLPLNIIKSCYDNINHSKKKHCGKCMSCKLLYNAIMKSKKPELIKDIF